MKRKVYIRISNKTNKMDISTKRKFNALDNGLTYSKSFYPTITLQLNLDIPDEYFNEAQAKLDLKIRELNINPDIKVTEEKNEIQR